ncbi:Squamosa promoter-binding-like protein 18 [Zea mays]|uniref:Squamosa promoter-binding-like protein 18 n=1 Tax=Zea mays TaxID=4577 RepID=A0A1D6H872_MAIZE|nr:Squamosa promoter-binding-like protein 18 [Zea mays]
MKRLHSGPGSAGGAQCPSCAVDGCKADLSKCRDDHHRHKVCEAQSKTPVIVVAGREMRFCQQCSRYILPLKLALAAAGLISPSSWQFISLLPIRLSSAKPTSLLNGNSCGGFYNGSFMQEVEALRTLGGRDVACAEARCTRGSRSSTRDRSEDADGTSRGKLSSQYNFPALARESDAQVGGKLGTSTLGRGSGRSYRGWR